MIVKTELLNYLQRLSASSGMSSRLGLMTISEGTLAQVPVPEAGLERWLPALLIDIPRIDYEENVGEGTTGYQAQIYPINFFHVRKAVPTEKLSAEDTRILSEIHALFRDDQDIKDELQRTEPPWGIQGLGWVRRVRVTQDDFAPVETAELDEALLGTVRTVCLRASVEMRTLF